MDGRVVGGVLRICPSTLHARATIPSQNNSIGAVYATAPPRAPRVSSAFALHPTPPFIPLICGGRISFAIHHACTSCPTRLTANRLAFKDARATLVMIYYRRRALTGGWTNLLLAALKHGVPVLLGGHQTSLSAQPPSSTCRHEQDRTLLPETRQVVGR